MQDFEKLGVFYLGKQTKPNAKKEKENLLLVDSKNFTTHAVCVGMTGSGKTGLGIAILEEAGLDKVPAIIIDPKGDMGNLLLTFPKLAPEDFEPWVDPLEAERKNMSTAEYASYIANTWQEGLAKWGEHPQRIQNLRHNVEMVIYTPASQAGIPISILSSLAAPSAEFRLDNGAMRDRVQSITSSLLGLIGIDADPIKSKEHILIATIIDNAWRKGLDLDIASLIQQVLRPPFDKVGALDLETFYPAKERTNLSVSLNNLLASPGFQAWMEGEPLEINNLLYTKEGKPKLSVITIAHLSEAERMFFVTLLLNQLLSWTRSQSGTSSLRALLYMDEIFGYFPPTAMPPSKWPMLTLLKQARAYGLGIVLATQNPVDLDYKGLANCGMWFIGKLQTERDKMRIVEGLNAASNGDLDTKALDQLISQTGNRVFILRSVYEKDPILFESRWDMSYLRGPLTLAQIKRLAQTFPEEDRTVSSLWKNKSKAEATGIKPMLGINISELFLKSNNSSSPTSYQPTVAGFAKLHFVDSKLKIDTWQDVCLVSTLDEDGKNVQWDIAEKLQDPKKEIDSSPAAGSTFASIPAALMQEKNYDHFQKSLATSLYQNQSLNILQCPEVGLTSKPEETEAEFRARVDLALREKRDALIAKVREKYNAKIEVLKERIRKAEGKYSEQQQQATWKKIETWLSMALTMIGAFFGRFSKTTINQAGTSMRRFGRMNKESQDVEIAEQNVSAYKEQLQNLEDQLNNEISQTNPDLNTVKIDTITIKPRKTDITVEKVALLWMPG